MRASLERRLCRIEQTLAPIEKEPVRVIVRTPWKRLDLTRSTCTRYRCDDGTLVEVVQLNGDPEDISAGQLERFIQGFPIRN